jgi:3-deoxy-7-phosphoheptulonate synthase
METTSTCQEVELLPSPAKLAQELPLSDKSREVVLQARKSIENIISGIDRRLLLIVGPCSIHDPQSALDYAYRLSKLKEKFEDHLCIIMRVYMEKPRTSVGWKGLINDPYMDDSCDLEEGLRQARILLSSITSMGMAAGMEFLDPLVAPYISDLSSWGAIGARTSESQTHRELASGLPLPVGFKNSTDGTIESAINSIIAAGKPHSFLSINREGRVCIQHSEGNLYCHLILRGGKNGPNYYAPILKSAHTILLQYELNHSIIVDCSHMNSAKHFQNQIKVWRECLKLRSDGLPICGLMVESNIEEGNQGISDVPLRYGVSVTDQCLGWDDTEKMITETYQFLSQL